MKNLTQKIQNSVEEIARIGRFNGQIRVSEIYGKDFSGRTNLQTGNIELGYNSKISKIYSDEKLVSTMNDIQKHEIDHHKYKDCIGCPQTIEKDYKLFFLPSFEILNKKSFNKQDVNYLTNALEDSILHHDLNLNDKSSLEGITNFFERIAQNTKNQKFPEFYEAHVKLNMFLWGNNQQKKRMQQFYTHSKAVNQVMKTFLDKVGHLKNSQNKKLDFLNENNWEKITEIYSEEFSKLMTPGYALPLINHSGAGTKGREQEDSSNEGNVFQRKRRTPEFKKGEVLKADKNGEKVPSWISGQEAIQFYYQNRAEQLIIKAETFSSPESMPLYHFGKRDFNPKKDNLRNVGFGFNDSGKLGLKKKQYHLDLPVRVKSSPKSFPQIKIGGDDISASMQSDILGGNNIGKTNIVPWGDNSKYHWSCLVNEGIFEYLKRNHLLVQDSIQAFFFGKNTQIVSGLRNIREKMYNPQFEGDTQLNWDSIKQFFSGRGNLIYTKSDGDIGNWGSIKDEFINSIKQNNHSYVHLHMGVPNPMTNDLQNAGFEVVFAEDGKGIVQKVIDLTDKIFRGEQK